MSETFNWNSTAVLLHAPQDVPGPMDGSHREGQMMQAHMHTFYRVQPARISLARGQKFSKNPPISLRLPCFLMSGQWPLKIQRGGRKYLSKSGCEYMVDSVLTHATVLRRHRPDCSAVNYRARETWNQ